MKNNSIRTKIIILYTGILGIILIFFSIYPIYITKNILKKEQEDALLVKARQIDNYIDVYTISTHKDPTSAMLLYMLFKGAVMNDKKFIAQLWERNTKSLGLDKDLYRIRNRKNEEVLSSNNFTPEAQKAFNAKFSDDRHKTQFISMMIQGLPYYGINYELTFSQENTLNLQLAMPVTYAQNILKQMLISYILGIVCILYLGTFIAQYLINKILTPIQEVTRSAEDISQKNLNLRISVMDYDREFKELVESFNGMISRLEKSFSYIKDFNSSVSHEMKTPLAIIKGELELALISAHTKEDQNRIMKNVLEEVHKLIRIIKDMLLLAEYEYKAEIFKKQKMDLVLFLKDVVLQTRVLTQEKNIHFNVLTQDSPLWIEGDPVHLRRVFFNLIHNAVKFTPANGDIEVRVKTDGPHVHIIIKDNGIGIPLENQPKIFEKFYRVPSAHQNAPEGNGLGLSLALAIVKAHQGNITLESELHQGSSFKVILPLLLQ